MPKQRYDYTVLGHSHAVSLLDAITDWRKIFRPLHLQHHDKRYSQHFQGWFTGAFPDDLMELNYHHSQSQTGKILARVITASSKLQAASRFDVVDGKNALILQDEFKNLINSLPTGVPIISFLFGNEHAKFMLGHLPPYDFYEQDCTLPCNDPNAVFLDGAYIDAYVEKWARNPIKGIMAMRLIKQSRILHVMPPPPRINPNNSNHMETLDQLINRHGFAPDYLRIKWYKRYTRHLAKQIYEMGCEVIYPPEEALTTHGFLREEFAEGLTHANSAYGCLLADHISQQVREVQ